jgi:PqqD family protein of HPr-rel-A system
MWRLIEPAGLAWRCWDDEFAVFHSFSGMTHYLDATAGAVFQALLNGPATVGELAAMLADLADLLPDDRAEAMARRVLHRFDDAGLTEPVP